jgi:hypothetical protein
VIRIGLLNVFKIDYIVISGLTSQNNKEKMEMRRGGRGWDLME